MSDNIRILIADDHAVVREGLHALIDTEPGMELAGGLMIEDEAFTAYGANLTPDVETGLGAWSDEEIIAAIRDRETWRDVPLDTTPPPDDERSQVADIARLKDPALTTAAAKRGSPIRDRRAASRASLASSGSAMVSTTMPSAPASAALAARGAARAT